MDKKLQEPLNAEERYLYGINKRLEILIEQLSSIVEVISKSEAVPVQENKLTLSEVKEEINVEKPVVKQTRKRKEKVTD